VAIKKITDNDYNHLVERSNVVVVAVVVVSVMVYSNNSSNSYWCGRRNV